MQDRSQTADDAPLDDEYAGPDDIMIDWCRAGDWYFLYDPRIRPPRDKGRLEKEYEELDPLVGPDGEKYVATHDIRRSWATLKKNGYLYLAGILAVLCDEKTFVRDVVPKDKIAPVAFGRSETMNRRNLEELRTVGFLTPIVPPNVRGQKQIHGYLVTYGQVRFASLFTRPKANKTRRLLLNGRPGNAVLNPPPYFTFFSPETIVRILRELEVFFGFTVDIRHCFYRLPMHRMMARFYAIMCGAEVCIPTVVPMGSTWGPALGQTTTVAMILYREPGESDLGVRVPTEGIPSILRIVDEHEQLIGFILICIDNIAVVCRSEKRKNDWYRRLERNAKVLKIFPFKKELVTHWTEEHFEFIGLEYETGRWRHCADRVEKWRLRYGVPKTDPHDKEDPKLRTLDVELLQSLVGLLVWDKRLRVLNVGGLREIFGIQRRALCATSPSAPTAAERELIELKWSILLKNDFQEWSDDVWPPRHSGKPAVILVTDASWDRWSWLEMLVAKVTTDANGILENANDVFPTNVETLEIYYKELYTVLVALRALRDKGRTDVDVTLVGDSQAVIGSIRKRMGPQGAWAMIDEIILIVTTCRWGLVLKWVESDGNVAHSATHLEKITKYRTERSWLVSQSDEYPPAAGGNAKRDIEGKLI